MLQLSQLFPQPIPTYNRAMPEGFLTVKEAAERLGVGTQRLRDLINEGRIPAEKFGRDWMIREEDLDHFQATWERKIGRPRKKR